MVHGQACRKTDAHPSCTHDRPGQMPEGRIYVVDITDLMGSDLPVRNAWMMPRILLTRPASTFASQSDESQICMQRVPGSHGVTNHRAVLRTAVADAALRVVPHCRSKPGLWWSQKCQKPQDYDTWSPPLPQQCLLGRNITMQRRKPDAMCFNGYDFTADDTISPCNCTEADIECEFGFEWSGHDCMPVPHVEASQCPVRAAQAMLSHHCHPPIYAYVGPAGCYKGGVSLW